MYVAESRELSCVLLWRGVLVGDEPNFPAQNILRFVRCFVLNRHCDLSSRVGFNRPSFVKAVAIIFMAHSQSFIQIISIAPMQAYTAQGRSRHSTDTVPKFHAEAPQATMSEGLAQGLYKVLNVV